MVPRAPVPRRGQQQQPQQQQATLGANKSGDVNKKQHESGGAPAPRRQQQQQQQQQQQVKKGDSGTPASSQPVQKLDAKQAKKANKRSVQLAKMDAKHQGECDFFWQCAKNRVTKNKEVLSLEAVFGAQQSQGIDFAEYNAIPVSCSVKDVEPLKDFNELLSSSLLPRWAVDNLVGSDRMRYRVPTPIQKYCVPAALAGHEVLACAQTGSGKTVAFLLPLVASVFKQQAATKSPCEPRALILAPTRELALQIAAEAGKLTFGASCSKARHWVSCCYGGASARAQLAQLAAGVEILVATPGRLVDFLGRGGLISLESVTGLVLDEADRMLDMGFEPQLRRIVELLPRSRQTLMFSATYGQEAERTAAKYLSSNIARITVGRVGSSMASIDQRVVEAPQDKRAKLEVLLEMLGSKERVLVFVNKKRLASWLRKELEKAAIRAVEIHGDRSQPQREAALAEFTGGRAGVLVATDVAARGLDLPNVAHVIQFDLPIGDDLDTYTHRIGRTGRAGRKGLATAFFVKGTDPKTSNSLLAAKLRAKLLETTKTLPDCLLPQKKQDNVVPPATAAAAASKKNNAKTNNNNITAHLPAEDNPPPPWKPHTDTAPPPPPQAAAQAQREPRTKKKPPSAAPPQNGGQARAATQASPQGGQARAATQAAPQNGQARAAVPPQNARAGQARAATTQASPQNARGGQAKAPHNARGGKVAVTQGPPAAAKTPQPPQRNQNSNKNPAPRGPPQNGGQAKAAVTQGPPAAQPPQRNQNSKKKNPAPRGPPPPPPAFISKPKKTST